MFRSLRARTPLCALALATCVVAVSSCQKGVSPPPVAPAPEVVVELPPPETPRARPLVHRAASAPMTLTASDGTGLRLASLESKSIVEGPLAFTELHLTFDNPESRTLEGRFDVTLPTGAAVARFAMKIDDAWQEAEVVETQAAREAYEDFLHRKQDPALLEQAAGNAFSARVFPIPAHGRKEIILSYSQELMPGAMPLVPLRGLPELERLDVSVQEQGGRPVVSLQKERYVPEADFAVTAKLPGDVVGLRSGDMVLVRVRPDVSDKPDPLAQVLFLVDTSASRALGLDDELRVLDGLVRRVIDDGGAQTRISVGCFDQDTQLVYDGPAAGFGDVARQRILARQALGASNVEQALRWAKERARSAQLGRVVLVGDGVATAGETEAAALRGAVKALADAGVRRLDAVGVGGLRDDALLGSLVTAGLERDGVVADAEASAEVLLRKLTRRTVSGVPVVIEGASFQWPTRLDGVQAGDTALVYAMLAPDKPVRVRVGNSPSQAVKLASSEGPLLERSFARASIESLLARQRVEGAAPELGAEIVRLSVRNRVLSPLTSFLVLETDADYARFKLDRQAPSAILSVQGDRLAVLRRQALVVARDPVARDDEGQGKDANRDSHVRVRPGPMRKGGARQGLPPLRPPPPSATATASAPSREPEPTGDTFGAGGLSLSGIGEGGGGRGEAIGLGSVGTLGHGAGTASGQGFGAGHGRLGGAHSARSPQIRMGATTVSGRLPPEVIQRIVRQQSARLRACYEGGLRRNPNLRGRVTVRFVIDTSGAVSAANDSGSDLPDRNVVACIVQTIRSVSFPAPEGGSVVVTYPLRFDANGGDSGTAAIAVAPQEKPPPPVDPYTGSFKDVMAAITAGERDRALDLAFEWRAKTPGDVLAYVALGEAAEARGDVALAGRAYGSLIDLFPARADSRRFAGARLEHLREGAGMPLALDTYAKARAQRPDHPSSHRLLAFAQLRAGRHADAFETLAAAIARSYPSGRFAGVDRVLREDLGLVTAAWIRAEPERRGELMERLRTARGTVEDTPSLRFVLTWETDANDVDFHIRDDVGGHAFYSQRTLPSGGELYADVTTGYGPECFTVRKPSAERANYTMQANYYSRGPMGYGMGKLEIIDHDGKGGLRYEERPYVVMVDHAFVDLGAYKR